MFERIKLTQLNDHIWLMDDNHEATGYLEVGKARAAVIDTMIGLEDVAAVVRTLTDLPVTVINTHGHCDHIYVNVYFDNAMLAEADFPLAEQHCHFPEFMEHCRKLNLSMPLFTPIHDGDIIDLGGLTLQVISIPEHTHGSVCLLLKEDRILFTGDAINRHLWNQLDESLPIRELVRNLDRIMWVKKEADRILHGHAQGFDPISLMDDLRGAAAELLQQAENGTLNDPDYPWFRGVDKQHPFPTGEGVICYSLSKL